MHLQLLVPRMTTNKDRLLEGDVESQISGMIWKGYAIDPHPNSAHLRVTQVHCFEWKDVVSTSIVRLLFCC